MDESPKSCSCSSSEPDSSASRRCPCTKNVGTIDRGIRVLLGLGAIALGILFHANVGTYGTAALIAVGGILLITTALSWCPIYTLTHLSTRCSKASCDDPAQD